MSCREYLREERALTYNPLLRNKAILRDFTAISRHIREIVDKEGNSNYINDITDFIEIVRVVDSNRAKYGLCPLLPHGESVKSGKSSEIKDFYSKKDDITDPSGKSPEIAVKSGQHDPLDDDTRYD